MECVVIAAPAAGIGGRTPCARILAPPPTNHTLTKKLARLSVRPVPPSRRAPCVAHAQLFRKQEQLAVKASATIDRALHPEDGALGAGGGGGGGAGYGYGDGGDGNGSNV